MQTDEQAPAPRKPSPPITPIRFRTADEFRSRPAWRFDLDSDAHKLHQIIGDYEWSKAEEIECGLKGCHRKHWHGYIVGTVDHLETNIRRDCGKTHFKVNWGEVHAAFGRASEERDISEWLENMVRKREDLLARASALYAVLANRTDEVRAVLERVNKESLVADALERVTRGGGAIQIEREIDADTAEARGLQNSQRFYLETVGRIFGVEALLPGRGKGHLKGDDLLTRLRAQIAGVLPRLSAGSLKLLNGRQRKERAKELQGVHALLGEAEQHVEATRRFLAPANLQELAKLQVRRPNERARRILQQFAGYGGRAMHPLRP